ncbi:MAG TPA: alpha/beta hydrolase [Candidatus Binatia bacterium]|nr:alpha/beta hydrolase [Candidatus Binatia bacterium]
MMNGTRRSAVGATHPWRDVTVDGVRLAADDEGAGTPALVCLHAIGHGARDFAALRRAFAPAHRVVALDWPGQGNSADDSRPPSAARYAALLAGVLDALGIERVVLVGNSIGGAAALRYAATHPERVAGLVLENPGGLDRPDRLSRRVIDLMVRFFAAGSRRAAWFPPAFAAYYRTVLQRSAAAAQRARIVASAYEIAPVLHDAWVSFGAPDADLRNLVPTIRCPTLFAWGVRDVAVQLRRSLPTIARFPNARLERFAAGHAAHLETPEELVAAVRRFVGAQKL